MDEALGGDTEMNVKSNTGKKKQSSSKDDIMKEEMEAETYTKRTDYIEKFQKLIILGVIIGYLVYGIVKLIQSREEPAVKYSENTIKTYDYPVVMGCMNGTGIDVNATNTSDYYMAISEIYAGGELICDYENDCSEMFEIYDDYYTIDKKAKHYKFQLYSQLINYYDEELLFCYIVIPPTNATLTGTKAGSKYLVTFDIYIKGMFSADSSFNDTISVPAFLVKQYQYSLEHQAFHMDELYYTLEEFYGIYDGDTISTLDLFYIAYETAEDDNYAAACSRNDLQLTLATYKYYSGSKTNAYGVDSFGAQIDTLMFDNSATPPTCNVVLTYYPRTKGKDKKAGIPFLYQLLGKEYLDYDEASLFSGVGGIMGTVEGILGIIFPLILFGISISFLKIQFRGYAPYPKFDDKFEYQLNRHLKIYLYQHRESIQNYLKS